MRKLPTVLVSIFLGLMTSTALQGESVSLVYDKNLPQATFAASEINAAVTKTGNSVAAKNSDWRIELAPVDATLGAQAYRISVDGDRQIRVVGGDSSGLMYGGLELAEAIRLNAGLKGVAAAEGKPYLAKRGIKFNIPLDMRTPSYSDRSDIAQANIPEVWSMDFWKTYLDEMARDRYNLISIWNLNPLPSMVKVPEFPDVALNDVWRTKVKLDVKSNDGTGRDMVRPEDWKNYEVVKKISIDEKITFWREVMQYAKDRGIDFYIFFWNTFTFGEQGKYGITDKVDNPVTLQYFRASIRELVHTYPLLAGIGLTAGEHMAEGPGSDVLNDQWLYDAYGEGARDALKDQPGRDFRIIQRLHWTDFDKIKKVWQDYPYAYDFSFKYANAHMYASTAPTFIKSTLETLPADKRLWLTVRNDDFFNFRWADPDFTRAFVQAFPGPDQMAGFYMGSDGYTWARENSSTETERPRQLVIQQQWTTFMLWGRLSYNPELSNTFFERVLAEHFPGRDASKLALAMATAGKIIPQVSRQHWRDNDQQWFPEAGTSHVTVFGYHTIKRWMSEGAMPDAGVMSIKDYVTAILTNAPTSLQTPPQVVEALQGYANQALQLVGDLRKAPKPAQQTSAAEKEFRLTLGDQEAMALLGLYYAEKIAAATELSFFDGTGDVARQDLAVGHLSKALEYWKAYAAAYSKQYKPQLYGRPGYIDMNAITKSVADDVTLAQKWKAKVTK